MHKSFLIRLSGVLFALGSVAMLLPAIAHADAVDQINNLLSPSASGSKTQEQAQVSKSATAPLGKFAASGRVTETINTGACSGSPEASSCTSGCDQISITGPVNATGLGNSNLSACITISDLTSSSFTSCFNGLGQGTIAASKGKSITFGIGGLFCIADAIPPSTPTQIYFVGNDTYAIENGTAPFTNAVGTGTLSFTDLITSLSGTPIAGSGQFTMAGVFAKQ